MTNSSTRCAELQGLGPSAGALTVWHQKHLKELSSFSQHLKLKQYSKNNFLTHIFLSFHHSSLSLNFITLPFDVMPPVKFQTGKTQQSLQNLQESSQHLLQENCGKLTGFVPGNAMSPTWRLSNPGWWMLVFLRLGMMNVDIC